MLFTLFSSLLLVLSAYWSHRRNIFSTDLIFYVEDGRRMFPRNVDNIRDASLPSPDIYAIFTRVASLFVIEDGGRRFL
jgi:hypothetical protein